MLGPFVGNQFLARHTWHTKRALRSWLDRMADDLMMARGGCGLRRCLVVGVGSVGPTRLRGQEPVPTTGLLSALVRAATRGEGGTAGHSVTITVGYGFLHHAVLLEVWGGDREEGGGD